MPKRMPFDTGGRILLALISAFSLHSSRAEGRQLARFLQLTDPSPSFGIHSAKSKPLPTANATGVFAEAAIASPSLLGIADSRNFRSSGWKPRVERIQRWIRRNAIEHFRELDVKNRDLALRRIAKQLDNLLAEKDFRLPRVRSKDQLASRRVGEKLRGYSRPDDF